MTDAPQPETTWSPSDPTAAAWLAAVRSEAQAELHCLPTRQLRRRRDRLAGQLLARGERMRREMLP